MGTRSNVFRYLWPYLQAVREGDLPYHIWYPEKEVRWIQSYFMLDQDPPNWGDPKRWFL